MNQGGFRFKILGVLLVGIVIFIFSAVYFSTPVVKYGYNNLNKSLAAQVSSSAWSEFWCDVKGLFGYGCITKSIEYAITPASKEPETEVVSSTTTKQMEVVTNSTPTTIVNEYYSNTYPLEREVIKEVIVKDGVVDVSRFVTRQEYDAQVDAIMRSIENIDTSNSGGGGGTSNVSSLEDLSDVASMTEAVGNLLVWTGSAWSNIATSSLGISGGGAVDSVNGQIGVVVLDTGDITENGNLYFTDARARDTLSSSATGLSYATSTGVFSLTSGYNIPLTASTTNWNNTYNTVTANSASWDAAAASTTALTPSYIRNLFSNSATGLTYNSSTGATSLTAGYSIPLIASTTEWASKVSSQWTSTGSDIYYNSGNIGIGTTTPSSKLTVEGTASFDNFTTSSTTATSTIAGNLSVSGSLSLTGSLLDSIGSAGSAGMVLQSTGSGLQWVATSSLGISAGGSADDGVLSHTFTATSTWNAVTSFDATSTVQVVLDATAMTGGQLILTIDGETVMTTVAGNKNYRVVSADSSITVVAEDTSYDIQNASFVDSFSVSGQQTQPIGVTFNPTGTKMFVVGNVNDYISEYTLSTGFDVSTASYVDSFSVTAQDIYPTDLAFNTDGTKMFVVGSSGQDINIYNLGTGFDVSTAVYASNFSVSGQDTQPWSIAFNSDGTKMFILGQTGNDVNEYTLGTGFDLSTASFVDSFSVAAQDTTPQGLAFSPDGTKMLLVGYGGQDVNKYNLSTGFDVSTASFVDSFSVVSQDTQPQDLAFNADGTKMFVVGFTGQDINEYSNLGSSFSGTAHAYISYVAENTGGADLAEMYATAESDLEAGDVVALDTERPGYVKKATGMAGERVVGIVATKPGIVLDDNANEGALKVPIALAGRVPVKVTIDGGVIAIGDLITMGTSTPGVARKAEIGDAVIGYALAPFSAEEPGTVEVFVNLDLGDSMMAYYYQNASSTASSTEPFSAHSLFERVIELAQAFVDGVLRIVEIVVQKLTATVIHTELLCVGNTCLSEEQVLKILDETNTEPAVYPESEPVPETTSDTKNDIGPQNTEDVTGTESADETDDISTPVDEIVDETNKADNTTKNTSESPDTENDSEATTDDESQTISNESESTEADSTNDTQIDESSKDTVTTPEASTKKPEPTTPAEDPIPTTP